MVIAGDAAKVLPTLQSGIADACVTSPPYLDSRPEVESPSLDDFAVIFAELRRVVSGPLLLNVGRKWKDGVETRWWNDLLGIAEAGGWLHLDTRVWIKPNANPIRGQVFADSHEYVFVLGERDCVLNVDAIRTPYAVESVARLKRTWRNGRGVKGDTRGDQHGRMVNPAGARARSFVTVYVGREKGNPHPSPMPLDLAEELVALATWPGQTVIDPFAGSGNTLIAALKLQRSAIGIEQSAEWCELAEERALRHGQLSLRAEAAA